MDAFINIIKCCSWVICCTSSESPHVPV